MKRFGAVMVMLAAVCLASCGDSSSGKPEFTIPTGTQTQYTTTTQSEDEQKMLTFKRVPSDKQMTDEQRKQAADEFTVYYSGRAVNEKTGEEQKISGSELQTLKKYAQDILDKKIETKFEGGDENYNITVGAFDKTVNSNSLSAMDKCRIDGFDENFAIVSGKFAQK